MIKIPIIKRKIKLIKEVRNNIALKVCRNKNIKIKASNQIKLPKNIQKNSPNKHQAHKRKVKNLKRGYKNNIITNRMDRPRYLRP
jgi:hypothetical protein